MLSRKKQIAVRIEDVEGEVELISGGDAKILADEIDTVIDAMQFEYNPLRETLSAIANITGPVTVTNKIKMNLRGSGSVSTAPAWTNLARACGWALNTLKKLTIGAISGGPFQHGETITQATSGATGRVRIATSNGTTTLYFVGLTGVWDGTHGITGGTSGATATVSAVAAAGFELVPDSSEGDSDTIMSLLDGFAITSKGNRGKMSITFEEPGKPAFIQFEMSGAYSSHGDQSLLSITHESTIPPAWKNASFLLGAYEPRLLKLDLSFETSPAPLKDATDPNSVKAFRSNSRKFSGNVTLEMVTAAVHDFHTKLINNTGQVLDMSFGADAGNSARIYIPNMQYTKPKFGDDSGIATMEAEFSLMSQSVSSGDDECSIFLL